MTQIFDESGVVTPVTAVVALPNTVTKVKTVESDGYNAVQLGSEEQKLSRVSGALSKSLGDKAFKIIQEIRHNEVPTAEVGQEVTVASFEKGDAVIVTGTSKSKGGLNVFGHPDAPVEWGRFPEVIGQSSLRGIHNRIS